MSDVPSLQQAVSQLEAVWKRSNRCPTVSACEHCEGIVRHAQWCMTQNAAVLYALGCTVDPALMEQMDHILLHGMGVRWNGA